MSTNIRQQPNSFGLDTEWILSPYSLDADTMKMYESSVEHQSLKSLPSSASLSSSSSSKVSQRDQSPVSASAVLNAAVAELAADLNSPEISFDLQQFISSEINSIQGISSSGQVGVSMNGLPALIPSSSSLSVIGDDVLLTELFDPKKVNGHSSVNNNFASSQFQSRVHHHQNANDNNRYTGVKREAVEAVAVDFSQNIGYNSNSNPTSYSGNSFPSSGNRNHANQTNGNMNQGMSHELNSKFGTNAGLFSSKAAASGVAFSDVQQASRSGQKKSSKKHSDKGSDEYKKRRERNNVAVRKSREKAKMRSRDTERKVSELLRDNDSLRKRLDLMGSQMNVLKTLLISVGVPSESIESEITRTLQMEGLI